MAICHSLFVLASRINTNEHENSCAFVVNEKIMLKCSGNPASTGEEEVAQIIDANLNRAREGLRVVEEVARFILHDEKLTKESITRTINTKGTTQNINYYLEAIRREHLRRAQEVELYHPNQENIVKLRNLVKDLANQKKFPK